MRHRCLQQGCPVRITTGSYCPAHKPYGPGWSALSKSILSRDGFRCWRCGGFATTTDHRIPTSQGGTDDPSNLRAACRSCNASKGGL